MDLPAPVVCWEGTVVPWWWTRGAWVSAQTSTVPEPPRSDWCAGYVDRVLLDHALAHVDDTNRPASRPEMVVRVEATAPTACRPGVPHVARVDDVVRVWGGAR